MFGLPIVQPGTLLQLIGAVTVQLVLLLVLLNAQPFLHRSDGFVAILADISLVLVFFCCMILEQDELVTDVGDVLPENLQRRFQIATGPVEAMMVASTFFVLLAVGLIFVQEGYSTLAQVHTADVAVGMSTRPDSRQDEGEDFVDFLSRREWLLGPATNGGEQGERIPSLSDVGSVHSPRCAMTVFHSMRGSVDTVLSERCATSFSSSHSMRSAPEPTSHRFNKTTRSSVGRHVWTTE